MLPGDILIDAGWLSFKAQGSRYKDFCTQHVNTAEAKKLLEIAFYIWGGDQTFEPEPCAYLEIGKHMPWHTHIQKKQFFLSFAYWGEIAV